MRPKNAKLHTGDPGPLPENEELRNAGETPVIAPEDEDSHGTPIQRVPGPGPNDEEAGAAGEDAVRRVTRTEK
jgi:hypothetical protein